MNRTAFYYDNRSNLRAVLDPDNGLTYYTYDSLNRMTSVKNPWGEVTQYEYSPGGRLLKRILGNGTLAYYSYDAVGQVRKLENVKSDLSVISSFEYERNAVGSPLSILREDGSVVYYEYDPKQQLAKETHVDPLGEQVYGWTWDYDLAGNRTRQEFNGVETTYEYNAANELTEETTGGATTYFEYDHNGNTTAQIAPGGTTQYHWDRENLMTQVDLPDGGHGYFAYDADGKRVEKRDSDGYTRFIYQGPDMLKLLQERDANEARQAQYTMGNGLEAMRRDGASSFYHYDWLGSTLELTDGIEAVTDTYLYNAWGEVLGRTGTTANPHMYVGRKRYYRMPQAGAFLLGYRAYDPQAARFASIDPARQGNQWYGYVTNLPTVAIDPLGLRPWWQPCRLWVPTARQQDLIREDLWLLTHRWEEMPANSPEYRRHVDAFLRALADEYAELGWNLSAAMMRRYMADPVRPRHGRLAIPCAVLLDRPAFRAEIDRVNRMLGNLRPPAGFTATGSDTVSGWNAFWRGDWDMTYTFGTYHLAWSATAMGCCGRDSTRWKIRYTVSDRYDYDPGPMFMILVGGCFPLYISDTWIYNAQSETEQLEGGGKVASPGAWAFNETSTCQLSVCL